MKKIETLQILQSNASKATVRNDRKLSSRDNLDFKNALDNKAREQSTVNQGNSSKDVPKKNEDQISDDTISKKPENSDLNSDNEDLNDEKTTTENIVNQVAFSANVLNLDIRPSISNIKLESAGEAEGSQIIQSTNLEGIPNDISKTSINTEVLDKNMTNSQAINLSPELVKGTEFKEVADEIDAKSIKNIEKNEKSDEFNFEKSDESGNDIAVDMINTQKTEKTDAPEPLEVLKIKVGDGQEVSSEKLVNEISKNVVIKAGKTNEYELQLDPENLGKIKVKLIFEDGKLTISMLCSNSKTANLLSEGITNLGQAIQQNTKSEVTVNVREENYLNNDQNQQNRQSGSNQQNQQNQKHREETEFEDQVKLGLWEIENLKRQFSSEFKFM